MVAPLGPPPARLPPDPPEGLWAAGQPLVRVYHEHPVRDPLTARTYGPLLRLDPHVRDRHGRARESPDGRGVLYLAENLGTALAEAFQGQDPEVSVCRRHRAGWVQAPRDVRLLDVSGEGAMYIGAVATLGSGREPTRLTQRWARRIYEQYRHLDGIRYRGAMQGGTCVALWQRAPTPVRPLGGDRGLWAELPRVQAGLAAQGRFATRIAPERCRTCVRHGWTS